LPGHGQGREREDEGVAGTSMYIVW
jgi:hypothetical protein